MAEDIRLSVGADTTQMESQIANAARKATVVIRPTIDSKGLEKISAPLGRITGQADEFTKSMEAANARVLAFGASVGVLNAVAKSFQNIVTASTQVEASLKEIQVATGETSGNLEKLGKGIFEVARSTGLSFKQASEATLEFARQGGTLEDSLMKARAALVLTRTTGLDAAEAVKGLTAAVLSFNQVGLDYETVVNKLAAVDTKFAVSSKDLIEGISRSASVAQEAGVSFDELTALITTLQEKTARGGAVIGNALKTIFQRVQTTENLDYIRNLGIAVNDVSGDILPATTIIKKLADEFQNLDSVTRKGLLIKIGGGFQIDKLAALLNDISSANGTFNRSLEQSTNAGNQGFQKIEQLNKTVQASFDRLSTSGTQFAATIGKIAFSDDFRSILDKTSSFLESLNESVSGGEEGGATIGKSIVKGIGSVITGPGALLLAGLGIKLFGDLAKFGVDSLKNQLGVTNVKKEQQDVERSILGLLLQNTTVQSKIIALEGNKTAQAEYLLGLYSKQAATLERMSRLSKEVGPSVYEGGIRLTTEGTKNVKAKSSAGGYMPKDAAKKMEMREAPVGASIKEISNFNFGPKEGRGTMIVNSMESVYKTPMGDFVIPSYSKTRTGKPTLFSASGYVPNFAEEKEKENLLRNLTIDGGSYSFAGLTIGGTGKRPIRSKELTPQILSQVKDPALLEALSNYTKLSFSNVSVGNVYRRRDQNLDSLEASEKDIKNHFVKKANDTLSPQIGAFIKDELSSLGIKPTATMQYLMQNGKRFDLVNDSMAGTFFETMLKMANMSAEDDNFGQFFNDSNSRFDIYGLKPDIAEQYGLPKRFWDYVEIKSSEKALNDELGTKFIQQLSEAGGESLKSKFLAQAKASSQERIKTASKGYVPNFAINGLASNIEVLAGRVFEALLRGDEYLNLTENNIVPDIDKGSYKVNEAKMSVNAALVDSNFGKGKGKGNSVIVPKDSSKEKDEILKKKKGSKITRPNSDRFLRGNIFAIARKILERESKNKNTNYSKIKMATAAVGGYVPNFAIKQLTNAPVMTIGDRVKNSTIEQLKYKLGGNESYTTDLAGTRVNENLDINKIKNDMAASILGPNYHLLGNDGDLDKAYYTKLMSAFTSYKTGKTNKTAFGQMPEVKSDENRAVTGEVSGFARELKYEKLGQIFDIIAKNRNMQDVWTQIFQTKASAGVGSINSPDEQSKISKLVTQFRPVVIDELTKRLKTKVSAIMTTIGRDDAEFLALGKSVNIDEYGNLLLPDKLKVDQLQKEKRFVMPLQTPENLKRVGKSKLDRIVLNDPKKRPSEGEDSTFYKTRFNASDVLSIIAKNEYPYGSYEKTKEDKYGRTSTAFITGWKGEYGIENKLNKLAEKNPFLAKKIKSNFAYNKAKKKMVANEAEFENLRTILETLRDFGVSDWDNINFEKSLQTYAPTKTAAKGYIPNFSKDAILDAIGREQSESGLPLSAIKVVQDARVRGPQNPDGYAVINNRDEPNGRVPNFAKPPKIDDALFKAIEESLRRLENSSKSLDDSFARIATNLGTSVESVIGVLDKMTSSGNAAVEASQKNTKEASKEAEGKNKSTKETKESSNKQTKTVQDSLYTLLKWQTVLSFASGALSSFGDKTAKIGEAISSFGTVLLSTTEGFKAVKGITIGENKNLFGKFGTINRVGAKTISGFRDEGIAGATAGFVKAGGIGAAIGTAGTVAVGVLAAIEAIGGANKLMQAFNGSIEKSADAMDKLSEIQSKFGYTLTEAQKNIIERSKAKIESGNAITGFVNSSAFLSTYVNKFKPTSKAEDALNESFSKTGLGEEANQQIYSTIATARLPQIEERLKNEIYQKRKGLGENVKLEDIKVPSAILDEESKREALNIFERAKGQALFNVLKPLQEEVNSIQVPFNKVDIGSRGKPNYQRRASAGEDESTEEYKKKQQLLKKIEAAQKEGAPIQDTLVELEKLLEGSANKSADLVNQSKLLTESFLYSTQYLKNQLSVSAELLKIQNSIASSEENVLKFRRDNVRTSEAEKTMINYKLQSLEAERNLRSEIQQSILNSARSEVNKFFERRGGNVTEKDAAAVQKLYEGLSQAAQNGGNVEEIFNKFVVSLNNAGAMNEKFIGRLSFLGKELQDNVNLMEEGARVKQIELQGSTLLNALQSKITFEYEAQKQFVSDKLSLQKSSLDIAEKELANARAIRDTKFDRSLIGLSPRRQELARLNLQSSDQTEKDQLKDLSLRRASASLSYRESIIQDIIKINPKANLDNIEKKSTKDLEDQFKKSFVDQGSQLDVAIEEARKAGSVFNSTIKTGADDFNLKLNDNVTSLFEKFGIKPDTNTQLKEFENFGKQAREKSNIPPGRSIELQQRPYDQLAELYERREQAQIRLDQAQEFIGPPTSGNAIESLKEEIGNLNKLIFNLETNLEERSAFPEPLERPSDIAKRNSERAIQNAENELDPDFKRNRELQAQASLRAKQAGTVGQIPASEETKIRQTNATLRQEAEFKRGQMTDFTAGFKMSLQEIDDDINGFQNKLGKQIPSDFRNGLVDAMKALSDPTATTSLKDRLLNVAAAFVNKINDALMQNTANQITRGIFGNGMGQGIGEGGGLLRMASGGEIKGGSGIKDDVPAMLMRGEYVVNKNAVNKYGKSFFDRLNNGTLKGYASGGYAELNYDDYARNKQNYVPYGSINRDGISFDENGQAVGLDNYTGTEEERETAIKTAQTDFYSKNQQTGQGGFFIPGQYGAGAIMGQKNLLAFATQQTQPSGFDRISGMGNSASAEIKAGSSNLTLFGLRNEDNPLNEDLKSAKDKALELYMQGVDATKQKAEILEQFRREEEERRKAEEEQRKQEKKAFWRNLAVQAAVMVASAAVSKIGSNMMQSGGQQALNTKVDSINQGIDQYGGFGTDVNGQALYAGNRATIENTRLTFSEKMMGYQGSGGFFRGSAFQNPKFNYLTNQKGVYAWDNGGYRNVTRGINDNSWSSMRYSANPVNYGGGQYYQASNPNYYIRRAAGGYVEGNGMGDNVPTMLNGGEFVVSKQAVEKVGYNKLQNINSGQESGNMDELIQRLEVKFEELINKMGGNTGNITINVESSGKEKEENSGSSNEDQANRDMARKIKDVVLGVIRDEKRMGGLLR
jgi:TP901 family phage tail tape measure protein